MEVGKKSVSPPALHITHLAFSPENKMLAQEKFVHWEGAQVINKNYKEFDFKLITVLIHIFCH